MTTLSGNGYYESTIGGGDHIWIANRSRADGGREYSMDEDDLMAISFGPNMIVAEVEQFARQYETALIMLITSYGGTDNVRLEWGVIQYYS
jgi:hypothetical protein